MKYKYKMTTTTLRCDDVSRADWRFVIRRSVHILSPPSTLTCESNDMNGAIIVPAQFSYRHRGKIDHCSSTIMTLLSMVHLQSSPTAHCRCHWHWHWMVAPRAAADRKQYWSLPAIIFSSISCFPPFDSLNLPRGPSTNSVRAACFISCFVQALPRGISQILLDIRYSY